MAFRLSGLVAAGGQSALDEALERRLREELARLKVQQDQEQLGLQRRQIEGVEEDRRTNRANQARTIDLAELKRVDDLARDATQNAARSDMASVLNMPGMDQGAINREIAGSSLRTGTEVPRTVLDLIKIPEVKRHPITTAGPDGKPIRKLVTEEELSAGVPEYREPKSGPQAEYEWVVRNNQPTQIRKGSAQPGDRPYDAVAERSRGAETGPSPYATERATRTVQAVDNLMSKVSRWTTGAGSMLSALPETDARNFAAELNTLKANVAFNELAAMRDASKTGGALGAVSEKEMALLESALGALDQGQSPANLKTQLQQIKDSVQRWQQAVGRGGASGVQDVAFVFNPATGKLEPVKK